MKHSGPHQPRLVHESPTLYLPTSGSTATGGGLGPAWAGDGVGVVSHPTPTAGFTTQFRRTRITSAASADNELGVHLVNAADVNCWRGNAASLGGFYFSARFMVNAIPNTAVRMFAGLSATTGSGLCVTATTPINTVGLWCDETDAGALTVVTRAGSGSATKTQFNNSSGTPITITLTAGILYEFVMIANPNQNVIVTHLKNVGLGTILGLVNVSLTMPAQTAFMAPQVGLSNAANAGGGDTSLDIVSIYARPNHFLDPAQAY